jgi:hypothetical protein
MVAIVIEAIMIEAIIIANEEPTQLPAPGPKAEVVLSTAGHRGNGTRCQRQHRRKNRKNRPDAPHRHDLLVRALNSMSALYSTPVYTWLTGLSDGFYESVL